jgi:negative regulator of replication initiation
MKTINLENDVFAELDKLTTEFFSHNDVIRKLLLARNGEANLSVPVATPFQIPEKGSVVGFVQSANYRMLTSGINKYLAVLSWLYKTHTNDFHKVENYRRGNRVYFGRSQKAIEEGGNGAIQAKQIPHSPIWTLATLDNRTKRVILTDLLPLFGFKSHEINEVVSTISDSGRHRGRNLFADLQS